MVNWQDDVKQGWDILSFSGQVQWFASKQEGSRKRVMGGRLFKLDDLIGTVRNAEQLNWDLYLQLNPARHSSKKKLSREDIIQWRYAVVDLDPDGSTPAPPVGMQWEHWRVFSGRGYQFWLPMDDGPPPDFDGVWVHCNAERLMNGWLHWLAKICAEPGWKVDTSCSDLARVVRCPGSVNQKTGQRAVIEGRFGGMEKLSAEFMQQYILPLPDPAPKIEFTNLLDLLPHLNGKSLQFLLYGVEKGERHNACYATCKQLHELGVPEDKAFDILKIGSGRCWDPGLVETYAPLGWAEIERTVQRVYGRQ